MKPGFELKQFRRDAFSLIECLTYMAIFFVLLGVAFAAYYRMNEESRAFTQNSADIVRAVQAGERWREDVRAATNVVQVPERQELRLASRTGEVSYFFRDGFVWRQGMDQKASTEVLGRVKTSVMAAEARSQVTAWRWDIELKTKRTNASMRPLFTFLAVPAMEEKR